MGYKLGLKLPSGRQALTTYHPPANQQQINQGLTFQIQHITLHQKPPFSLFLAALGPPQSITLSFGYIQVRK